MAQAKKKPKKKTSAKKSSASKAKPKSASKNPMQQFGDFMGSAAGGAKIVGNRIGSQIKGDADYVKAGANKVKDALTGPRSPIGVAKGMKDKLSDALGN